MTDGRLGALRERYRAMSDAQLMQLVRGAHQLEPEALSLLSAEAERRGLLMLSLPPSAEEAREARRRQWIQWIGIFLAIGVAYGFAAILRIADAESIDVRLSDLGLWSALATATLTAWALLLALGLAYASAHYAVRRFRTRTDADGDS